MLVENYLLYILASITLIITPGTDTVLVTKNLIQYGKKGGQKTALGTGTGILFHTLIVTIGVATLLTLYPILFQTLKWTGAIYLFYLGLKSIMPSKAIAAKDGIGIVANTNAQKGTKTTKSSCYIQGVLTNVLNPKIAVFFLTFLPQFVDPNSNTLIQFLILGLTYVILLIIWLFTYVHLMQYVKHWFEKPSTIRIFDIIAGIVMIGLAFQVAFH